MKGLDGFIVGPYDISGSLGVPGQFEHPNLLEALEEVQRVASNHRAVAGFHVVPPQPEMVIQKVREGYRLVAYSVDMLFLGEMCRGGLGAIRTALPREGE